MQKDGKNGRYGTDDKKLMVLMIKEGIALG
jgi:hypothetical protein